MANETFKPGLIRARREEAGLSQEDLAERLGVSRNTIVRWENVRGNANPPKQDYRVALAKELGGTPEDYEWSTDDFERQDELERIRREVQATIRRLLSQ